MMLLTYTLVATSCLVQTAVGQCLTGNDASGPKDPRTLWLLQRSQLDFSLNLLKAVSDATPDNDNVFFSPLSIYNALLLAYFSANTHTEASIRNALRLPANKDKLEIMYAYKLQKQLSSTDAYQAQVNNANRFFVSKEQTVRDCMKEDFFGDEIQTLDFSEKQLKVTVDLINNWISNVTRGNIKNLLSADAVSPGSQLILANAAYFKGVWKHQFDSIDTKMGEFSVNKNKTVSTPMMFQLNTFGRWRSNVLGAEVLELPYKGGEISLFLVLPDPSNQTNAARDLLRRLNTDSLLELINQASSPSNQDKVEVRIPKFTVEKTLGLTSLLEDLGVGDLFQQTSDLTFLTGGPPIRLNNAVHKAKIQVDEKGTEAAAATVFTDTRIPADAFYCDRPFIYLLYDKERTTLLFAGIYTDPTL